MKIALGVFDGVHLGHIKVIERAHRVITFHPHPNKGAHLLTTLPERQDLIQNLDVIPFNSRIGELTPEEFVRDILVKRFRPKTVLIGDDYAFGYNRSGSAKTMEELGRKYGFEVEIIPEVDSKGTPVRSSRIRHLLSEGKVNDAAELLGRDYSLSGKIVRGKGIGRTLGFPTVNVHVDKDKLIPMPGVYSGYCVVNNTLHTCAISIGERETFGKEHTVIVEAFLLNFKGDLYGKRITLFFEKFIRAQKKFKSAKALQQQIKKDIVRVRD